MRDVNLSAKYAFVPGSTDRKLNQLKNPTQNFNVGGGNKMNMNANPISPNPRPSGINNIMDKDPNLKDSNLSPSVTRQFSSTGFGTQNQFKNTGMTSSNIGGSQINK